MILVENNKIISKHELIVSDIREKIVTGAFAPGVRLANRVQFEEHFHASTVTVQKALDQLRRDGFVESFGRRGTFVAAHPPHLCQYALAFEDHPEPTNATWRMWPRFNSALREEAMAVGRSPGDQRRIKIYYDIRAHVDVEDYRRLVADVRNHRVAGVIFVTLADDLAADSFWDTPNSDNALVARGVSRVCLNIARVPGVVSLLPDNDTFIQMALNRLRELGRQNVAIVTAGLPDQVMDSFMHRIAERGMSTHPYWIQGLSYTSPQAVRNAVHGMFNPSQTQKPDALIVIDDHLVEQAGLGLLAAGVRVPDEVSVVAHANFPFKPTSVIPVEFLGFNVRGLLTTAMDLIDQINRGNSPGKTTLFPPSFERQVSAYSDRAL